MKSLNLLAALLVFAACGPATRGEQVALITGNATAGKFVYDTNCASCHGGNAKGTSSGVNLLPPFSSKTEAELLDLVINGKKNTAMPSFSTLSDQQLADVYAYIKSK